MKIKGKSGELTTQQLVILIVLIVSFVIILFLIFRLDLGKTTDSEICRNSVVTRGSSVLPTESVPLKCQRSYLCITQDGNCDSVQLTNPVIKKVKNEEETYAILSKELADCWWMFGEGEINYVGSDMTSKLYCSICAQVAFDNSMNEIFSEGQIDKENIFSYMQNNNVSGKDEKYLYYLYDLNNLEGLEEGLNLGSINLDKQYYVMMGITSDVSKLKWAAGAAVLTVAGVFFAPIAGGVFAIGWGAAAASGVAGGGIGTLIAFAKEGGSGNQYTRPSIVETNSQEFEGLGCKSITTLS
ncbi:MAG: hypothetical protein NTW17_02580 [Candidatus Pacearchaeota archaeon]|nr:hypothetical protein [Candidatus Pacearchaeota archaeon]